MSTCAIHITFPVQLTDLVNAFYCSIATLPTEKVRGIGIILKAFSRSNRFSVCCGSFLKRPRTPAHPGAVPARLRFAQLPPQKCLRGSRGPESTGLRPVRISLRVYFFPQQPIFRYAAVLFEATTNSRHSLGRFPLGFVSLSFPRRKPPRARRREVHRPRTDEHPLNTKTLFLFPCNPSTFFLPISPRPPAMGDIQYFQCCRLILFVKH